MCKNVVMYVLFTTLIIVFLCILLLKKSNILEGLCLCFGAQTNAWRRCPQREKVQQAYYNGDYTETMQGV